MSLSSELTAFAHAIRNALAEGAHMVNPEAWIEAIEFHFSAATPAVAAPVAPAAVAETPAAPLQPSTPEAPAVP